MEENGFPMLMYGQLISIYIYIYVFLVSVFGRTENLRGLVNRSLVWTLLGSYCKKRRSFMSLSFCRVSRRDVLFLEVADMGRLQVGCRLTLTISQDRTKVTKVDMQDGQISKIWESIQKKYGLLPAQQWTLRECCPVDWTLEWKKLLLESLEYY